MQRRIQSNRVKFRHRLVPFQRRDERLNRKNVKNESKDKQIHILNVDIVNIGCEARKKSKQTHNKNNNNCVFANRLRWTRNIIRHDLLARRENCRVENSILSRGWQTDRTQRSEFELFIKRNNTYLNLITGRGKGVCVSKRASVDFGTVHIHQAKPNYTHQCASYPTQEIKM